MPFMNQVQSSMLSNRDMTIEMNRSEDSDHGRYGVASQLLLKPGYPKVFSKKKHKKRKASKEGGSTSNWTTTNMAK